MEQNRRSGWVVPVVSLELRADDALDILKEDDAGLDGIDGLEHVREEVAV
tara:strand:- start:946 stop:1095 length:150 start_codon:yes stop_codon:yes gene_type:complete